MMNADLIHKALASPVRREILTWLKEPEGAFGSGLPIKAIQARSGLSQSTISAHVAAMIEAGLLVARHVGQFIIVSRNEEVIGAFIAELRSSL
ncbi:MULTISPECIES: helix-turn-helix domain-containing protein [unclassified Caballeronia]|uniref:ArsR/SmtB family transcription factor n=1 Tax=unclassified Caballeronia TaxID=2646786 RepID=UPI0028593515|nr:MULTISPECIES: helix-turn-helix domain-containing protein [unclassified Caballeronia]MDR5761200.1 helix-turn-helix domain-containing protein [Caballeronia sp. LZ035]MDR5837570.1 helix-turn-helix domain-containing protein [Caballeronia sp. LZ034LL]